MSRTSLPAFKNTVNDVFVQDTPVSHSGLAIAEDSSSSCREPASHSSLLSQSPVNPQSSTTTFKEQDHGSSNSNRPNLGKTPIPSRSKGGMEDPRLDNRSEQPSIPLERATADRNLAYSNMTASSTSLPTSSQKSGSARLSSVVTPRPYGASSNRLTSVLWKSTVSCLFCSLEVFFFTK